MQHLTLRTAKHSTLIDLSLRSFVLSPPTMNLTIDAAQEALANPSEALKETLAGASQEAQTAISSLTNGSSASHHAADAPNDLTARLQVVDEVRTPCERIEERCL